MNNILKRASGLILAATMLTATLPTLAHAGFYVRVTKVDPAHLLWVRKGPGMKHRAITHFKPDETDIYIDYCKNSGWCRVSSSKGWAWAYGKFLAIE